MPFLARAGFTNSRMSPVTRGEAPTLRVTGSVAKMKKVPRRLSI